MADTVEVMHVELPQVRADMEPAVQMFVAHGYGRDTALLALMLQRVYGELLDIEGYLVERDAPGEDDAWKER